MRVNLGAWQLLAVIGTAIVTLIIGLQLGGAFENETTTTVIPSCDWASEIYGGPNQGCVPREDHAAHAEGGYG